MSTGHQSVLSHRSPMMGSFHSGTLYSSLPPLPAIPTISSQIPPHHHEIRHRDSENHAFSMGWKFKSPR